MGTLGDSIRVDAAHLETLAASVDALEAGGSPPPPPPSGPTKLIGFGNSVMLGVRPGVVETDTFVYKIAQARGFSTYQNMGVGGDNISQMRARLPSVLAACEGYNAHVLVSEAINSKYVNLAPATYEADYLYIVQTLLGEGIKVTVMTDYLWRDDGAIVTMQPYLDATMKAGSVPGVNACVDVYRELVYLAWFYGSGAIQLTSLYAANGTDKQHPSAAGHTFVKDLNLKFTTACSLD